MFFQPPRSLPHAVDVVPVIVRGGRRSAIVWPFILVLLCLQAVDASAADAKARIREICHTEFDIPSDYYLLLEEVNGFGERGRQALLKLANARDPDSTCALRYLIRLDV